MTLEEKRKLIAQAAKLTALGYKVEEARGKLRRLMAQKVSYDSDRMRAALEEFQTTDTMWIQLKREHLAFRNAVTRSGN